MASSAYIKLVEASKQKEVTLAEIKDLLDYYKDITAKTGEQLKWEYSEAAFPYEINERTDDRGNDYFYLKSNEDRYNNILLGVGKKEIVDTEKEKGVQYYIQVTLPNNATHGDKGKANELAKFIAKKLAAELHLFNGRIMYFYDRK